jgi:hypothetical protein
LFPPAQFLQLPIDLVAQPGGISHDLVEPGE